MLNAISSAPRISSVGSRARPRRRDPTTGRRGADPPPLGGPLGMSKLTRVPFLSGAVSPADATGGASLSNLLRQGVSSHRTSRVGKDHDVTTYLSRLVLDLEEHVASAGWDQPPQLFALVETADLLRREPQLAGQLGVPSAEPGALTPVDQGELPPHRSLDELLAGISWPPEVLGTAMAVERLMV